MQQESKPQCTSDSQASVCIMHANVSLSRASHRPTQTEKQTSLMRESAIHVVRAWQRGKGFATIKLKCCKCDKDGLTTICTDREWWETNTLEVLIPTRPRQ